MKLCKYAGCYSMVQDGYCERHKQYGIQKDQERKALSKPFQKAERPNAELYNTRKWRKLRQEIVDEYKCCSICGRDSKLEVHHRIQPKGNDELFYDKDNLLLVCFWCHLRMSAKERKEARH